MKDIRYAGMDGVSRHAIMQALAFEQSNRLLNLHPLNSAGVNDQIAPVNLAAIDAANRQARDLVLATSIDQMQPTYGPTVVPAPNKGAVINIPLRNVGLLKRLYVEVTGSIAQAAAETLTRTKFGAANIFSNVTVTDMNNQQRINCPGYALNFLNTMRRASAVNSAFTNDSVMGIGANVSVNTMPSPVTTVQTFRQILEIPISYSDEDLRGAMYTNVINAQFQLSLTINPNFVLPSTGDETLAVYKSSTVPDLGSLTGISITVYQNYLYQLPTNDKGVILPWLDLANAYLITTIGAQSGLVAGQDATINFTNARDFLSTLVVYDDQALNAPTNVNYFALTSANYTNVWKMTPWLALAQVRNLIGDDLPQGVYYFNHRRAPIRTEQFGNMQLVVNPASVAGANSAFLTTFEAMARMNLVANAGSLQR